MNVKVGDELICIKEDPWVWGVTFAPLEGFQAPKYGELVKVVGVDGVYVRLANYNPALFRFSLYGLDGSPNFEKPANIEELTAILNSNEDAIQGTPNPEEILEY